MPFEYVQMPYGWIIRFRTKSMRAYYTPVYTPHGWRVRSKATGRFVKMAQAWAYSRGIGRTRLKLQGIQEALPYLSDTFIDRLVTDTKLREDVFEYLLAGAGYGEV